MARGFVFPFLSLASGIQIAGTQTFGETVKKHLMNTFSFPPWIVCLLSNAERREHTDSGSTRHCNEDAQRCRKVKETKHRGTSFC